MSIARIGAAIATVVLFGAVAIALGGRVEDLRDRPFGMASAALPRVIPLQLLVAGSDTYFLRLHAANARLAVESEELDIAFATAGRRVAVRRATLSAGSCLFVARAPAIDESSLVRFQKERRCEPGAESTASMLLNIRGASAPLFVWAGELPPGTVPQDAVTTEADGAGTRFAVQGRYVEWRGASVARRIDLLAYAWHLPRGRAWMGVALAIAALLLVTGAALACAAPTTTRSAAAAG